MRWALVVVVVAALSGCAGTRTHPDRPPTTVTFEGSGAVLYVDVADRDDERRRGLMDVERLPDDQGMAFVYDDPVSHTFWMKDTRIPLSIAFVDEGGRVIGLRDMEPCRADPCPSYGVDEPYVLAIEANQGWFEDEGVRVGDRVELGVMADG